MSRKLAVVGKSVTHAVNRETLWVRLQRPVDVTAGTEARRHLLEATGEVKSGAVTGLEALVAGEQVHVRAAASPVTGETIERIVDGRDEARKAWAT
jgi:hypothetical protein